MTSESLKGNVVLALVDPPYNVRGERSMKVSLHELFRHQHMNKFVEVEL